MLGSPAATCRSVTCLHHEGCFESPKESKSIFPFVFHGVSGRASCWSGLHRAAPSPSPIPGSCLVAGKPQSLTLLGHGLERQFLHFGAANTRSHQILFLGDTGPFASRELSKAGLILLLPLPPWSHLRSSRVPRPCHQPLPTSKVLIAGRQEGSAGVRTDTKESGCFSLPAAWDEPSTSPPKPTESSAQAAGRYKGSERCRGGKCCATAGMQPSPELKLCRASTPKHSLRVLGGVINWGAP